MSTSPLRPAALAPIAIAIAIAIALLPGAAKAAGPEAVASVDRALWPDPVDSPGAFDAASFAENVFFARAMLEAVSAFESGALALGPKATHRESVALWRDRTVTRLLQNLRLALAGCPPGNPICAGRAPPAAEALRQEAARAAEAIARLRPAWAAAAEKFYEAYAREQLRLAALFPAPSSEILPLSDREDLGDRLPDRSFLLTFDDGPTPAGGETDRIAAWLRSQKLSAVFFALDEALRARRAAAEPGALPALYAGQCLGSHGREHKPHPTLASWRASIDQTRDDVRAALPESSPRVPFRPPYGQRSLEMVKALEKAGDPLVLWNIDSQDWNAKLPADRVSDRVFSLMLLWRSGIILFHDVHPRALRALPGLAASAKAAGLVFQDCRQAR